MNPEALDALRRRFVERTREDRAVIAAWRTAGPPAAAEVERLIHNLAGAAGTFGFPALNAAAARIDDHLAEGRRPADAEIQALLKEIDRLP